MKLQLLFVPLYLALNITAFATDITFNYSFTVSFLSGPIPGISGSFGGSFTPTPADDFGTNASSLTYVNLQINGFTYTTANVELWVQNAHVSPSFGYTGVFTLRGSLNSPGSLVSGTDDFTLVFFDPSIVAPIFSYTSPGVVGSIPSNPSVSRISAVPDSGTALALLAFSTIGLALASKRLNRFAASNPA